MCIITLCGWLRAWRASFAHLMQVNEMVRAATAQLEAAAELRTVQVTLCIYLPACFHRLERIILRLMA